MKRQTKLVAVASASALLAIGASMTSFAAAGWVEEDGEWFYYDNDGNRVEDEWKKSGDNWYWLDSELDGGMAIDKLIEDDDYTYYVDSNGVMVRNTWVKVVNEDQDDDDDPAEYNYYYMQSNGKAYKQTGSSLSKKTIDGKRYAFDEDGKMLYGWVDGDGEMHNDEDGWQDVDASSGTRMYYFGSWDDGSMKTGWQKITVHDERDEKDDEYDYWFAFKSDGRRREHANDDDTWKSGNKYYHFDQYGAMVNQWYQTNNESIRIGTSSSASSSSASGSNAVDPSDNNSSSAMNWSYFGSVEDGAKVVKGWFKVVPPTEDNSFLEVDNTFAQSDSDDESERWYYNDGSDEGLIVGQIKKIKGKYYGFWPDDGKKGGRMLTGLCALKMNGDEILEVWADGDGADMDSDDLDDFMDEVDDGTIQAGDYDLYYFGNDNNQDTDGAMKTGSITIDLDGDSYSFFFEKTGGTDSRGKGLHGIDDDVIYKFGQKMKADSDEKYILVVCTGDINDDDVVVLDMDGSDVRKAIGTSEIDRYKDGTTKVYYEFDKLGYPLEDLYIVNTAGKVQTSNKTGLKDGDDYYWYLKKDSSKNARPVMYTDDKDLGDNVKKNWDDVNLTYGAASVADEIASLIAADEIKYSN